MGPPQKVSLFTFWNALKDFDSQKKKCWVINDTNTLRAQRVQTETSTNRWQHSPNVTNSIDICSGPGVCWQWWVIYQPPPPIPPATLQRSNPSTPVGGCQDNTHFSLKKSSTRHSTLSEHRAGWQLNMGCFGPSWATFSAASDNFIYFYTEQFQRLSKPESSATLLSCSAFARTVCLIWVSKQLNT